MDNYISILTAVLVALVFIILLSFALKSGKKNKSGGTQRSRQLIIRDATKKLAQDPHNISVLTEISNLYFREHAWDKAFPYFQTLYALSTAHPEIDQVDVSIKYAICAVKLGKIPEAFKALFMARQTRPDHFDVNFYTGQAYFLNKDYEKSIPFFKKAIIANQEVSDTYKFLAQALYNLHRYKESLPYFKRALDANPENRELMFQMADVFNETGNVDRALKIFIHMRPDPEFGARACLAAGIIHANNNQLELAIQDLEIGTKHIDAPLEMLTNIRYRLALCYLKNNNLTQGLHYLKEIQVTVPNYKDVYQLINRYQELNQNKNLQTYLMAGNSDFVALCRKIVVSYYKRSRVKIVNISVQAEFTEVLTEVDTDKWEDSVIFRFYRTTGSTGELFVRDLHAKLRETKAGKGICFSAGTYTDEARKYIEGRPIDLIEKASLVKMLATLDSTLAIKL
ncbi:MAG: tetratricopeptide repeat protein [Treponema sp.]|nr:tetratricopeptide repeat protein [Treponema sp.]